MVKTLSITRSTLSITRDFKGHLALNLFHNILRVPTLILSLVGSFLVPWGVTTLVRTPRHCFPYFRLTSLLLTFNLFVLVIHFGAKISI